MQTVRFLPDNDGIIVVVNEQRKLTLGWQASLECCKVLDRHLRNITVRRNNPALLPIGETGIQWRGCGISFREEQDKILVIAGGKLLFDMNTVPVGDQPSIARQIWAQWQSVTKDVEEWVQRERVAKDAAILHRAGANIGIANNPKIREEARKMARDDTDLRRYMKDNRRSVTVGITSDEVLPAPTVLMGSRSPAKRISKILSSLPAEVRSSIILNASKGK